MTTNTTNETTATTATTAAAKMHDDIISAIRGCDTDTVISIELQAAGELLSIRIIGSGQALVRHHVNAYHVA